MKQQKHCQTSCIAIEYRRQWNKMMQDWVRPYFLRMDETLAWISVRHSSLEMLSRYMYRYTFLLYASGSTSTWSMYQTHPHTARVNSPWWNSAWSLGLLPVWALTRSRFHHAPRQMKHTNFFCKGSKFHHSKRTIKEIGGRSLCGRGADSRRFHECLSGPTVPILIAQQATRTEIHQEEQLVPRANASFSVIHHVSLYFYHDLYCNIQYPNFPKIQFTLLLRAWTHQEWHSNRNFLPSCARRFTSHLERPERSCESRSVRVPRLKKKLGLGGFVFMKWNPWIGWWMPLCARAFFTVI